MRVLGYSIKDGLMVETDNGVFFLKGDDDIKFKISSLEIKMTKRSKQLTAPKVTPEQHRLVTEAAALKFQSVSAFLAQAAVEAAEKTLANHKN